MTKFQWLLFSLVFFASPLLAQRGTMAIPAQAEMEKYPLHSATHMSWSEVAQRKLHYVNLAEPAVVLNYYRSISRFVLETLPVGTTVISDSSGVIRYKADCVNRLVLPAKCPTCLVLAGSRKDSLARGLLGGLAPVPVSDDALRSKSPGFWDQVSSNFDSLIDWTKSVLSWILPFLLWLLLVALVLMGLWWLFNQIRNNGSGRPTSPAPRPIVTPPTAVAPPMPPAPTPAPVAPVVPPVSTTGTPTAEATHPAPALGEKAFVHFTPADGRNPNMLRFSDHYTSATFEKKDGVNTIRFS